MSSLECVTHATHVHIFAVHGGGNDFNCLSLGEKCDVETLKHSSWAPLAPLPYRWRWLSVVAATSQHALYALGGRSTTQWFQTQAPSWVLESDVPVEIRKKLWSLGSKFRN